MLNGSYTAIPSGVEAHPIGHGRGVVGSNAGSGASQAMLSHTGGASDPEAPRMGILPPPEAIPQGLPVLPTVAGGQPPPLISLPANTASLQQHPVIPTVKQEGGGAGRAPVQVPVGQYLSDTLLPLPQRLVDKISRLEFVEMSELLPEY
jgi:hypothetical protein